MIDQPEKYPMVVYKRRPPVKRRTDSPLLALIFDVLDWAKENPDLVIAIGVGIVTAGIYLRGRSRASFGAC